MNTNSFKIYLESTTQLLLNILTKFYVQVNLSVDRLYELFIVIRQRYYNFQFINPEEIIITELQELSEVSKIYVFHLEDVKRKYEELEKGRKGIMDFIEDSVISSLNDNEVQKEILVDYLNTHKAHNVIFANLINLCTKEVDVMKKTFINYNSLIEFKELNPFNHYLHIIN
jgi:hypothetical protein